MILDEAKSVLKIESDGISNLIHKIDDRFIKTVDIIYHSTGRTIVSGIGKSGLIGRKISATLNSTGTRSMFLHPVEAMHGDLGIVSNNDVFLAMSYSGETEELNILLPSIRNIGCKIIAFTGGVDSTLAKGSDLVIDVGVEQEACPMGLAPTASTTALLAMGDALAVVLINKRNFKSSDFKKFHPGGALGQRLAGNVSDIMLTGDLVPSITDDVGMEEAVAEIERVSVGSTLVTDKSQVLSGIITDGDIRRLVAGKKDIFGLTAREVMTKNPRKSYPDAPVYDALNIMEENEITMLPITDSNNRVKGILHLHDILGKGAFKFNGN